MWSYPSMLGYTRNGRCAYTAPITPARTAAHPNMRRLTIGRRHMLPDEIDIMTDRGELVFGLVVHGQRDRAGETDSGERREKLRPIHHSFAERTRRSFPQAAFVFP